MENDKFIYAGMHEKNRQRRKMTICIATICEHPQELKIVFCADRLVTYANGLTFEQGNPKVDFVDENCLVMSAGLASESDEIVRIVSEKVQLLSAKKGNKLKIKEIAFFLKKNIRD